MSDSDNFENVQRMQKWLQTAITNPQKLSSEIPNEGNRNSRQLESVDRVVSSSETLSAADRISIYQRSYRARLVNCFRSLFPVLLNALGKELFDHFAIDFLDQHPPTNYSLSRIADGFPHHLASTRPDADSKPDQRESWPDFIIELATLEHAFLEVYNCEGVEGKPTLCSSEINEIRADQLPQLRFVVPPSTKLFKFRYPVSQYFTEVRNGKNPELPNAKVCYTAIARKRYRVGVYELSSQGYNWLDSLRNERQLELAGEDNQLFRESLNTWLDHQLLLADRSD